MADWHRTKLEWVNKAPSDEQIAAFDARLKEVDYDYDFPGIKRMVEGCRWRGPLLKEEDLQRELSSAGFLCRFYLVRIDPESANFFYDPAWVFADRFSEAVYVLERLTLHDLERLKCEIARRCDEEVGICEVDHAKV